MSFFVNNVAGSLAGTQQQGQVASKKLRRQEEEDRRRGRVRDEFERSVDRVLEADAVRSAKDSTQEESREDQTEHNVEYHRRHDPDAPGGIDLSA